MRGFLAVLVFALAAVAQAAPPAPTGPLSPEHKALFEGVNQDAPPEKLSAVREDLEGRHYLTCDENWLDKWYDRLQDLGGIYAGVGTDQGYVFIGWMKPVVSWMTDYDPWVQRVHQMYAVAFADSADIDAFIDWWNPKKAAQTKAHLLTALPGDEADNKKTLIVYDGWGAKIYRRLIKLRGWFKERKVASFVTDDTQYAWVRQHVLDGRVKPVLCNLLDEKCFVSLGDIARKLEVPMRALYTSNAEGYWPYPQQFRENMYAQNFDEKSLILRTLASKKRNGDYRYNSQTGFSFQAWLRDARSRSVGNVVPYQAVKDENDIPVSHIDNEPPPPKEKKP